MNTIVLIAAVVGVCWGQPTLPNENLALRSNTNAGFNLGSLVAASASDSAKSSFPPQSSSSPSEPKEPLPFSGSGQRGPGSPAGIRTPINRANQVPQSPLEPTDSLSPQLPNRAGTFSQPLPGTSDLVPRVQTGPGQNQRPPSSVDTVDTLQAGQQPNRQRPTPNSPPVWQPPPRPSEQSPSASDPTFGSQRPSTSSGLTSSARIEASSSASSAASSAASSPAGDSPSSGSASRPTVDPVDRGQQPPAGGPLIVPRIITPQQLVNVGAPVTDGAAGNRAGVQTQANANVESNGPNPTFGANKPPTPTWQPAAPLNQRSPAQPNGGNGALRQPEAKVQAQEPPSKDDD